MKSLFNTNENQEIINRINSLTAASQAQWGKMNVAQAMAHCQVGLRNAYGQDSFKRGLIGILFGGLAKKSVTKNNKPFAQNLPTGKSFIVVDSRIFEEERAKLVELVKQFRQENISTATHPFFGKMTKEEWDIIQWKHLDHHLRQFGA